jgi:hypothetical protein
MGRHCGAAVTARCRKKLPVAVNFISSLSGGRTILPGFMAWYMAEVVLLG